MNPDKYAHIIRLIVRSIEGQLSDDEARELACWRMSRPQHEEIYRRMTSEEHFADSVRRFVKSPTEQNRAWSELRRKTIGRKRRLPAWTKYAAAALLPLLGLGGWQLLKMQPPREEPPIIAMPPILPGGPRAILMLDDGRCVDLEDSDAPALIDSLHEGIETDGKQLDYAQSTAATSPVIHTLSIPRGGEYTLVLADGSRVYLNAESQLEYPVTFTGCKRRVTLKGEAYFEVAKNAAAPFIVTAEGVDVEVLGTEFCVRAYANEQHALTTLVEGAVKVRTGKNEVSLTPSEQADVERGTEHMEVRQVDVAPFVAWRHGRIVFDNVPLKTILDELSRWYDVEISYTNEKAADRHFSLNMEKYTDFQEILRLLEQTRHVKFTVTDGCVMVN